MNENLKWAAAAVAVVGLSVGAVLYFGGRDQPAAPEPVPAPEALPAEAAAEPAIKHPLPQDPAPQPLPSLDNSDGPLKDTVAGLIGPSAFERFMVPDDIVRHFVVTVDNLSEHKLAQRVRPLRPTPGLFATAGTEDAPVLDPANYARYQALVDLLRNTDTAALMAAYTRYYPLLQDAYANLGHPPQYFNDRLVEVIDHLLATPDVPQPIALTRPGVLYEFADPDLEALSSGQKLLLRMGPEQAAVIKRKLIELRAAVTRPAEPPPGG